MKWFWKKQAKQSKFLFDYAGKVFSTQDFQAFPLHKAVLNHKEELAKAVFFPLCSIQLQALNPDWEGLAHFIYVFREPDERLLAQKYTTKYCNDYSLGFDVLEDKYQTQCSLALLNYAPKYEKYQRKVVEKYQRFAKSYQGQGLASLLPKGEELGFLIKRFGTTPQWMQPAQVPLDLSGKPMQFIGQVRALDFIGENQYLYLFYSPQYHYFVQVEQYT